MKSIARRLASYMAGTALAMAMTAAAANAAVTFSARDCGDGDPMAELKGVCSHTANTAYMIDVLFDATDALGGDATKIWGLEFSIADTDEILKGSKTFSFKHSAFVVPEGNAAGAQKLGFRYRPLANLAGGNLIGTLSFTTGKTLVNDGKADITMEGWGNNRRFFMPTIAVGEFEVQPNNLSTIPVPAPALLMLSGMAAFAGVRRKRRT